VLNVKGLEHFSVFCAARRDGVGLVFSM